MTSVHECKTNSSLSDQVDVVIRLHDPSRLFELHRCLFSLVNQSYREVRVLICTQSFSNDQIDNISGFANSVCELRPSLQIRCFNYIAPKGKDARSHLINLGIRNSNGRYLAFLDYDDCVYPSAYETLIEDLKGSEAAVAFGAINEKHVTQFETFAYTREVRPMKRGRGLADLLKDNFCPIHSFVIDRSRVDSDVLYFDTSLTRHEDYDFLLRLTSAYQSSFNSINVSVGDYFLKDDGSNSVLVSSSASKSNRDIWENSTVFLDCRRRLLTLSIEVQRQLGISTPKSNLTVANFLEKRSVSR